MIGSLLIANRGEIACRIMRTARQLGIRTIAVYSDADAKALHVREADAAVRIGAAPAVESYLNAAGIIAAAKATGADAIHPGYGFLSENADFAQAVVDAGLSWVGPTPAAIRAMGLKDTAKKIMADAGVPVTPGYLGEDQSKTRLQAEAKAIGYPLLIKAIAGGGGKGMRRVDRSDEFSDMLASCRREASAAFGNDRVLLEKYVQRPRHIEVQIFGDTHGNVVHLFERDCSLQRRHQKVIEEAPAPGLDGPTRAAICATAVKAARAVEYVGAGTIEFIADVSDGLRAERVWFMEMNTRLQVEHPVTEAITGEDLVEWQLRVASGEELPKRQEALTISGCAIEARLYAENPDQGFLPSAGRLDHFVMPTRIRVDSGFEEGDRISSHYDPLIAKLIVHGETRDDAAERLGAALGQIEVWPVKTNAAFIARIVQDPEFVAGEVDTGFIPSRLADLLPAAEAPEGAWRLAATAMRAADFGVQPGESAAWQALPGFRINAPVDLRVALRHGGETRIVAAQSDEAFEGVATARHESILVFTKGQAYAFTLPGAEWGTGGPAMDGTLTAPMPGRIVAVDVRQGGGVTEGQRLVTIEAMKMEHALTAPFDGVVVELRAAEGTQVREGELLIRIAKPPVETSLRGGQAA